MRTVKPILIKCLSAKRAVKTKVFMLIAVAGVMTALLLAGSYFRRPVQAAAPSKTATAATPTPSGTPDYSNVNDILGGRRSLLRDDDLILAGIRNSDSVLDYRVLQTNQSSVKDVAPPVTPDIYLGAGEKVNSSLTVTGRMFAFDADVIATAYTVVKHDENLDKDLGKRVVVSVYSPTAKSYANYMIENFPLNDPYFVNSVKMADLNGDGFDELIVNYSYENAGTLSYIKIVNAVNVEAFSDGLALRGSPTQTKPMGVYNITNGYALTTYTEFVGTDSMTVGDFNGDKKPDILGVVPGNNGKGLQIVFHTVDEKTLQINKPQYFPLSNGKDSVIPPSHIAAAAGKFNTNDYDQLLIAYAQNGGSATVLVVDFDNTTMFKPVEKFPRDMGKIIQTGHNGLYDWTGLLKLRVGRFDFTSQYDQAVLLHGNNFHQIWGSSSYDFRISTLNIRSVLDIEETNHLDTGDLDGSMRDITLGNYDRVSTDPSTGLPERSPDLQIALHTIDKTGYTANFTIYDVNTNTGELLPLSSYSFDQGSPYDNLVLMAGDTQGRSMRLGEPTKIVIEGTAQPSVVAAAPPMHVDFVTSVGEQKSKEFNVSAIPKTFFTGYDTEDKSSTQSSTSHTQSWSFGSKERIGGSYEIGSVKKGAGVKFKDVFTAMQELKGSIENKHGRYESHEFNVSQETYYYDLIWYTQSRFNVYVYPVIGKTVCSEGKADENGDCADSDKVPLLVQFSGPDNINTPKAISASQIEWYQPPWEYGNLLSYPASYKQLAQIYPEIKVVSKGLNFSTDNSKGSIENFWNTKVQTGITERSSQNFNHNNDFSIKGKSAGFGGIFGLKFSWGRGFKDLNKSVVSLGKSTGISVNKSDGFPNPVYYAYNVNSYIFGRQQPGGFVDKDFLLTDDVSTFSILQTAFTVDPLSSTAGSWWKQAYNKSPDIALNHPNRWNVEDSVIPTDGSPMPSNCRPSEANMMSCADLAPVLPAVTGEQTNRNNPWMSQFHDMRGFFISDITDGEAPGQAPQIDSAYAGDKLALQTRVYNYSLAKMNPGAKVHVRFYGMEWNEDKNLPQGDSFLIGEDTIDGIPPFDSISEDAPLNWKLATTTFDTSAFANKYLVFWVVVWSQEDNGELTEEMPEHGLKSIPLSLKNLVDANGIEEEYSNNVGFYKSAFHIFNPRTSTSLGATNSGEAGIRSINISERKILSGSSVEVTAVVGASGEGASGVDVIFYDGDPKKGGKAFDVERISHIRGGDSFQVKVPFKPQGCGSHQIYVSVDDNRAFKGIGLYRVVNVICPAPPAVPKTKADCQNNGWKKYGSPTGPFSNESRCISYSARQR